MTKAKHGVRLGRPRLMANGTSPEWPEDALTFLKSLCETDHPVSFSRMASAVNAKFPDMEPKSRSAVLGKAHRMGFNGRRPYQHVNNGSTYEPQTAIEWSIEADNTIERMAEATSGEIAEELLRTLGLVCNHQHVRHRRRVLGVQVPSQARTNSRGKQVAFRKHPFDLSRTHRYDPMIKVKQASMPSTALDVSVANQSTCMFPLNSDVRDLKVCGSTVTCGAYCDYHAARAYSQMPTNMRNRLFHKPNQYDCEELTTL